MFSTLYDFLNKCFNKVLQQILFSRCGINFLGGGVGIDIRKNVYIDNPNRFFIGDNSLVNYGCNFHIGASKDAKIVIGNNVQIGMCTTVSCVSHQIGASDKRAGNNIYLDVIIDDGVWIGANVVILPGVRISKGCVIAAGSVVLKSTEPNSLYAGVPAIKIKNYN